MKTTTVTVNRNHKDTVFRKLFSDKNALLSLYNALFNTEYTDPNELTVVTLENAIYMKQKNDLACIIDLRLTLIEHQSSFNPNMPLRMLKYIVDLFDTITIDEDIYSSRQVFLPSPVFIVFYNGLADQPERRTLRLSDSYMSHPNEDAHLDLVVTQLNINDGYNEELKQHCPELFGYAHFVSLIRSGINAYGNIKKATDEAIDICINEGILPDFFNKNRKEVAMMSIYEFDEERHNRTLREDGREEVISILLADGTITPEKADEIRKQASNKTQQS